MDEPIRTSVPTAKVLYQAVVSVNNFFFLELKEPLVTFESNFKWLCNYMPRL